MKVKPTMKLKISTYLIAFLALGFMTLKLSAQNKLVKLEGIVKYDSTKLQDINIINKATNSGTSSDTIGSFTIYAKEGDSISFSSIVYENRIIKISKTHINSQKITVYLEPDFYQLDEVMLEKKIALDFGNVEVLKGTILNNDVISNRKAPNARRLTDPNAQAGGINPVAIFMMLTKKSRKKRKARKLKLKLELEEIQQLKIDFPTTIKNLYGDIFFKEALNITEDKIYLFLDYCEGNGLSKLYRSNEIEIKNFLVKQARKFNSFHN